MYPDEPPNRRLTNGEFALLVLAALAVAALLLFWYLD